MPYVKNPNGRISEVDEEDAKKWLGFQHPKTGWMPGVEGFTRPSPEEITTYLKEREIHINRVQAEEEEYKKFYGKKGVYLVTVTPGGKDGYGIASVKMLKELHAQGVDISTENLGQRIALLFHAPHSITQLEAPIRILYTMFESDHIPESWYDYLEQADLILVPSKWCAGVFKKAGFEARVVPLGFEDDIFQFVERQPKKPQRKDYVFLHYNAFNIRKGFPEVFKAFNKAFEPTEPVKLVLKTTLEKSPLPITKEAYPNIDIINGSVNDEELMKILADADCFVFPSRGEGFGIPPLEAMATGLPVIVPNAHGISEYFNPAFMYEVKVKETCPGLYSRYKNENVGNMVVCDVDDLAAQMRYVYNHEEEALAKGRAASFYAQNWTFKKTATALKQIFDELMEKPETERPLRNILPLRSV